MISGQSEIPTPGKGLSRRDFTKAAAWSVPIIAIGTAAPAYAATVVSGVAGVQGSCDGTTAAASFTISVSPLPAGSQVQVTLTHTLSGAFSVTSKDSAFNGTGNGPFVVTGDGSAFSGGIAINFILGQNETGRVTATVTGLNGFSLSGDTEGFVNKRRDGNSGNYNQCSTD